MNSNTKIPNLKWAERKDLLFITIDVNEMKNPKIDLIENRLIFRYIYVKT